MTTLIESSILDPKHLCISPTSGFHHARPHTGGGFCTFSGQVIASMKLYRKYDVAGAYLDLDGHFGNSIPDSREFVEKQGMDLDKIIPMNINPQGSGQCYLENLSKQLSALECLIRSRSNVKMWNFI